MFNLDATVDKNKAKNMNPVVLAYIGDAVYSLYTREKLTFFSDLKVNDLHRLASSEVKASSQAEFADILMPVLTEEESDIFRRARNAKKTTKAKNATVAEYNKSTGFEALLGYLYIIGEHDRLNFLLNYKNAE
ncbi:MAG: Mini-ribonuclease 3 [Clostridia bacterium]|nr:Mini-ribonuclease 3 [Clostridia bacterium]MBR2969236.1 Mini-ribonuclease 3 [Clostridia bacterium]